jgi:molybdopterin synthase catalytic subunit/molybdopterin synthase sulfur carrier subunit
MPTIRVQLFAAARDLARADALFVDLPAGATISDLKHALVRACPALEKLAARSAVAMDERFASNEEKLAPGAAVALLPPVSGG